MKTHLKLSFPLLLLTSILAGCSSTPQVASDWEQQQYCYTDETITQNNDVIDSRKTVDCTDRPAENWRRQLGVADTCREYLYNVRLNNRIERRRGYVCQKMDGSWEIVPTGS